MSELADFAATFESLLEGGEPPPRRDPWLGWCLVALCRQRLRQEWLVLVRAQRLADVTEDEGEVPGMKGHHYSFHGRGLLITGPGNEQLDVDFYGDEGATIDPYFFAWRILHLEPPPTVEARLARYLPTSSHVAIATRALSRAGMLEHPHDRHVFCLCAAFERMVARIAKVDFDDPATLRRWAVALGDGELASGVVPGRDEHRAWLLAAVRDPELSRRAIEGIELVLSPEDVTTICLEQLRGDVGGPTGQAIALLERSPIDATVEVERFLARLDPRVHHPHAAVEACRYLLRRHPSHEAAISALRAFAAVEVVKGYHGNPMIDELAVLALEFLPREAVPLVDRALRDSPAAAERMASVLAAIDQPWCIHTLERVAVDPSLEAMLRRRAARGLALSQSELARRRGRVLEPAEAPRDPDAIGYSFEEVDAAAFASEPFELDEETRELGARLRARLPDDGP